MFFERFSKAWELHLALIVFSLVIAAIAMGLRWGLLWLQARPRPTSWSASANAAVTKACDALLFGAVTMLALFIVLGLFWLLV